MKIFVFHYFYVTTQNSRYEKIIGNEMLLEYLDTERKMHLSMKDLHNILNVKRCLMELKKK